MAAGRPVAALAGRADVLEPPGTKAVALHVSFGEGVDLRSLQRLDAGRDRELAARLVDAGVWVAARGIWYVSEAHGRRELEVALERVARVLAEP